MPANLALNFGEDAYIFKVLFLTINIAFDDDNSANNNQENFQNNDLDKKFIFVKINPVTFYKLNFPINYQQNKNFILIV